MKNLIPYITILLFDFYLLPFLAQNTGIAMLVMLCVMPFAAFLTAMTYGLRHGFSIWLAAISLLLFIPTIFIYYNISAWVYAPIYTSIIILGNGLGRAFYMKR